MGVLLTLGTGLVPVFVLFNPGGAVDPWYGFPLSWKEAADIFCGPFNPAPCPLEVVLNIYNPVFFVADVTFYTLIGYGSLQVYRMYRPKNNSRPPRGHLKLLKYLYPTSSKVGSSMMEGE